MSDRLVSVMAVLCFLLSFFRAKVLSCAAQVSIYVLNDSNYLKWNISVAANPMCCVRRDGFTYVGPGVCERRSAGQIWKVGRNGMKLVVCPSIFSYPFDQATRKIYSSSYRLFCQLACTCCTCVVINCGPGLTGRSLDPQSIRQACPANTHIEGRIWEEKKKKETPEKRSVKKKNNNNNNNKTATAKIKSTKSK